MATQHHPPLPSVGFVRQATLLPMLGFSATTLWRRVKNGTFPQPIKLSERVTAWRAEEIHTWMAAQGNDQPSLTVDNRAGHNGGGHPHDQR